MKDYSEFLIILDRSGSMQAAASDHEGGLNSFVQDQKQLDGDVRITLIQFDSQNPCEVVMDAVHPEEAKEIKLYPRGGTPLLDAIGKAVSHFSERLDKLTTKPDLTVVMVITDGEENASHEWTKEKIKSLIAEKEKASWKFLYLGANVDAFAEAGAYGTLQTAAGAMNFRNDKVGTQNLYGAVSSGAVCARMYAANSKSMGWVDKAVGGALVASEQVEAYNNFNWTDEQKLCSMGQGSCTCVAYDIANGGKAGDPNCPIHAREVALKQSLAQGVVEVN